MLEARRLLGVCQAALGRFAQALDSWKAWSRLGRAPPARRLEIPRWSAAPRGGDVG